MRILISGGAKTQNIVAAVESRLSSSGIDFIQVPYIEDIQEIFSNGDYFDRAIITEDSWTRNKNDDDETSWRYKINAFSSSISDILSNNNVTYAIVSQTQEMAAIISEEVMSIRNNTSLVVKAPPYPVNFFVMLSTWELSQIPEKYLYKPIEESGEGFDEGTDEGFEKEGNTDDNLDQSNNEFTVGDTGNNNANRLPIKQGFDDDPWQNGGGEDEGTGDLNWEGTGDLNWEGFDETGENNPEGFDGFQDDLFPNGDDQGQDWNGEGFNPSDFDDENELAGTFNGETGEYSGEQPYDGETQEVSGEIPDWSGDDTGTTPLDEGEPSDNNDYQGYGPEDYDPSQYGEGQEQYAPDQYAPDQYAPDQYAPDQYAPDTYQGNQGGYSETKQPGYQDNYTQDYGPEDYKQAYEPSDYQGPTYADDDYADAKQENKSSENTNRHVELNNNQLKNIFNTFANRGTSIAITGFGGTGTSIIAYNLANVICNIRYKVLLVDFDTVNKTQSYLSSEAYEALQTDGASILSAVNSNAGINAYAGIVRPGFGILAMGMASDSVDSTAFKKDKLFRFLNQARTNYEFIIYDLPFDEAVGNLSTVTLSVDDLVLVLDTSNWGISKALIRLCNIGSDDLEENIFSHGQLLFNRYRGLNKLFGERVKNVKAITKAMDKKLLSLIGTDNGYHFSDMYVCGLIKEDRAFEDGWYNNKQYSDTRAGFNEFTQILKDILLHS